ncbi:uncharacterized protein (DUF1684 family) [Devosia sp. UYZn731]|uniref:DUF1684 domain-containing protein n=1 Tax=Devosia sp. UYZn731 TaxID=3156345 RepID=UPI003396D7D7
MASDYDATIKDWQAQRIAHLTAEDGWLNVIGRFWLEDGTATVGSSDDNDIVLSAGPARLGSITQDQTGVTFQPAEAGAAPIVLKIDPANPPRFSLGSLRLEVTTMDGRNALRVRDVDAPERVNFAGLPYFPTDPSWRKTAEWVKLDEPVQMDVDTVAGIPTTVSITRKAVFTHDGVTYELLPTHGTAAKPQFVLRDLTSKSETYGASRFLYGADLTDDTVVLDFNKAFNPPCAFTVHAVCPLPPPENILPIRIEAGEQRPKGH